MFKIFQIFTLIGLSQSCFSDVIKEHKDFNPDEVFHINAHEAEGLYLVCIYNSKLSDRADGTGRSGGANWSQINYKATIVEVAYGSKKVGSKIDYVRVADSKLKDIPDVKGDLRYVFFKKDSKGKVSVNPQAPFDVCRYNKAFEAIFKKHINYKKEVSKGE